MANIEMEAPGADAAVLRKALREASGRPGLGVIHKHIRVAMGIDSLTAGPGDIAGGPVPALEALLKAKYGDGGPGLFGFHTLSPDCYFFITEGGDGTVSSFTVADPAWDAGARSHSLCGIGLSFLGANTGVAGLDPGAPWDRCRIYFELASEGAGFSCSGDGGDGETVSTATHAQGVLGTVDIKNASTEGGTNVGIWNIVGDVNLFAADFLLDAGGVTVNNCAISGTTMVQHLSLDEAWQKQWIEALRPDAYILNGGANDQYVQNGAAYSQLVTRMVRRWRQGTENILLVRPCDQETSGSGYLPRYDRILKSAALAMGCGYLDQRDIIGDYAAAVAANLMADTSHPNLAGNALIAAAYDTALG